MSVQEAIDKSVMFQALDADQSKDAVAFNKVWKGCKKGADQLEAIDTYYDCFQLITREKLEKCEEAVMQLKQIEHTLIRFAASLAGESKKAANSIIKDVSGALAEAGNKLKVIRVWVQV
jgi:hypothetical protein